MFFGAILGKIFGAAGKAAETAGSTKQALAESKAFTANAEFAEEAADITARQTEIQLARQGRSTFKALGGIRAAGGASGVKQSGSVLDILQSSAQEASLDKSIIQTQGRIDERDFEREAEEARALASGAKARAKSGAIGGAFGIVSDLLSP